MVYKISKINNVIFVNKQNILWNDFEQYLKRYTKKLRGALAKVKANAAQIIGLMIKNATNRRWSENKDEKHKNNASGGWYSLVFTDAKEKWIRWS